LVLSERRFKLPPQPKQEQPKTVPVENISKPQPTDSGKLTVQSTPANADIFVDGAFIGNAPAALKVKAGKHTIRAVLSGYKDGQEMFLC
jgi:hypothetical protein